MTETVEQGGLSEVFLCVPVAVVIIHIRNNQSETSTKLCMIYVCCGFVFKVP